MSRADDYFSDDAIRADLKGKTVRGGAWTGAAQVAGVVVSLATVPVLARLLQPADFGLVAMVVVFTGFARMFVDAGLSMATLQRDRITHQQVTNLFWVAVALGSAIAALVAAMAPVIAWFYDEPRLGPIVLAMTIAYVFAGLTIQHQALLRRRMHFRSLAVIQVGSVLLGQIVGIAWAWRRYGEPDAYWALVWIPITVAAATMAATWIACPWRPGLPRRGAGVRSMLAFGANMTGFTVLHYFSRQADKALIGWRFGEVQLGYYERAYRIFLVPMSNMTSPLTAVALPALSRLVESPERFSTAYLQIIRPMLILLLPGVAFLMLHAEGFVSFVLGDAWLPSVPIFRCLAIMGLVQPFNNALLWILMSHGRSRDILFAGVVGSTLSIASYAVGLPWGPIGVALAYSVSGVILYTPFILRLVSRTGPVSLGALVRSWLMAAAATVAVAVVVLIVGWLAGEADPIIAMAYGAAAAAVAWAAVAFSLPPMRGALAAARKLAG